MSEKKPRAARPGLLVPALLLLAGTPARGDEASALLARAERVKEAFTEGLIRLRVSNERPGAPPSAAELEVAVKKGDARIRFLDPGEEGKIFLTVGNDAWLLLPKTRNPIKVPRSQRLRGGFAAADVSRTRFVDDYDALAERTDMLDGRDCQVLRLMARKGHSPTYPVVRVWIDRKEGLYRKAVFLLPSGRTAKEARFDAYKTYRGVLGIERMTIVDALIAGTTVVEYLDYERRSLPDTLFSAATARDAAP